MKSPEEITLLAERAGELFAPRGDLAAVFAENGAAYAHSERQCELAQMFARGIAAAEPPPGEDGRIGAIEAAAGMGKTTAYLSALALNAAMFGEKSLVSTRTRALQRQIESEWPLVAKAVARMTARIGGEPKCVSLAPRIGRRNFIDRERTAQMAEELWRENPSDPRIRKLRIIAESAAATFDELRQETDPDFFSDPAAPLSEADLRLTPASSEGAAELFRASLQKSGDADIIVVNHALALLDARLWGGLIAVPSARRVGIFDEADTLPDQARSMADETIRPEILRELLDRADSGETAAVDALFAAAAEALENGESAAPMTPKLADLSEAAANALRRSARETPDPELREELAAAALSLRECAKAVHENNPKRRSAVVFAAPNRRRPALALRVPDPAAFLSRLWRARSGEGETAEPFLRAVVFTSATLSPFQGITADYNPHSFLREIGADFPGRPAVLAPDAAPYRPVEPQNFGKMEMIVLAHRAAKTPFKTDSDNAPQLDDEFAEYAAMGIRKAREAGGRTLALVSSFAVAAAIAEKIPDAIQHREGESLSAPLEKYRADQSAVLVTPSAWEGVNPLGPPVDNKARIQNIVIPALPFPPGDEAGIRALNEKIRARESAADGRQIFFAQARAAAVRKLRQGIGRGVRAKNDICRLWILDPRFPLPESFCKNPRNKLTQGPAARYSGLDKAALPARFFNKHDHFAATAKILGPDGELIQPARK